MLISALVLAVSSVVMWSPSAGAHTESDVVAVPAGSTATVSLKPTHGCDASPTTEVYVRAPVEGATAVDVAGWTSAAEPDGEGNTVLEWTGGNLPTDQTGSFGVTFLVPDTPGELLTFPAVQGCADGAELAWIDGDPEGDYPAPRLLVLPAGAAPATSLDEVPVDAPGREQLTQILDIDNPGADTAAETTTTTSPPAETPTTEVQETADDEPAISDISDNSGSSPLMWILIVALLAAVAAGVIVAIRRRGPDAK